MILSRAEESTVLGEKAEPVPTSEVQTPHGILYKVTKPRTVIKMPHLIAQAVRY